MIHPQSNGCRTRRAFAPIAALLCGALAAGCSLVRTREPATPHPHAFIKYLPPDEGDDNLRVAVKDLIDMRGEVTTAGSAFLANHAEPAAEDAECLRLIRRRVDVTLVGKTNLSEFAIGVSGCNDYFGTPVNPLDPKRVPGGSSSGSAVAVAMGLADVALGTDTAGSIRVPAACCGVSGLKTTFGRVSIKGIWPIAPNYFDTVGPIARDVDGLVTGMGLLEKGFESEYRAAVAAKPSADRITIGRLYVPGTDRGIDRAIDSLFEERGFRVVVLDDAFVKEWEQAQRDGNLVAAAAAWYNDGSVWGESGVSARARQTILYGDLVYATRYEGAEKRDAAFARRDTWRAALERAFARVDAIALPVLKRAPLRKSRRQPGIYEARFLGIQNTVAVNYAHNPAVAIPVPLPEERFPVTSVQFVGPLDSEAELLNIARLAETREPLGPARWARGTNARKKTLPDTE